MSAPALTTVPLATQGERARGCPGSSSRGDGQAAIRIRPVRFTRLIVFGPSLFAWFGCRSHESWVADSGFGRIRWRVGFGRFGRIPGGVRSGDESIETRNLDKLGRFWAILDDFGRFGAILGSKLKLSPKWVPDSDGFGRQSDSDGFGRIPEAQIWNAATQHESPRHADSPQGTLASCRLREIFYPSALQETRVRLKHLLSLDLSSGFQFFASAYRRDARRVGQSHPTSSIRSTSTNQSAPSSRRQRCASCAVVFRL